MPHRYPHTPGATEQELLPPSLGLQEGKRKILLARLSNLLIVFIYIYICIKNPIKSCPKYQRGEICQGGKAKDSVPFCLCGRRTSQNPGSAKKMHPNGNNQAKQNHPKSTKQRFLLQGRHRLGKSGSAVCPSVPTDNHLIFPSYQ